MAKRRQEVGGKYRAGRERDRLVTVGLTENDRAHPCLQVLLDHTVHEDAVPQQLDNRVILVRVLLKQQENATECSYKGSAHPIVPCHCRRQVARHAL